jgi:outer membrane protein assembly factor BamB
MTDAPDEADSSDRGEGRPPRRSESELTRRGEGRLAHRLLGTRTDSVEPPAMLDGDVYGLLENPRRRYLLYCLDYHDGEVSLSRAVDVVTAWEKDCPVEEIRSTDRRCVYSALRRRHIPRLETENVVAFDEDAGTLSFDLDAEKATRWLFPDTVDRWSKYYLGLAAVGGFFVLADFLAELPELLPEGGEHALVAVLFLGLTVIVVYDHWR